MRGIRWCVCVLALLGCGSPDPGVDAAVPDAHVASDAAPDDAASPGDAGSADAGSADAGSDAGSGVVAVTGHVVHAHRAITEEGLEPVELVPTVGVAVELVSESGATRSARVITDADGAFTLVGTGAVGEQVSVRVIALRDDSTYQLEIQDLGGATYSVTTATFEATSDGTRDVEITEADNSGAFAIFNTMRHGLDFVRSSLPRPPPPLLVKWERGNTTPGGTSYLSSDPLEVFVLGGPEDADEYDVPVLLHEFGHFVEHTYSHSDSPGGDHDGSPTDPLQAWGEGFGTWFGCAANDSPVYLDSLVDGSIALAHDLSALPVEDPYVGDAEGPLTQDVSEYLVAGSLWSLTEAGTSRTTQIRRQLRVLLDYFSLEPIPDRGVEGVDYVDFLDGYECVNDTSDREAIRAYLVTERGFPYDFDGASVCP